MIAPTTIPTSTPAPTATPDPWAEYAPYTIEGLRGRSYGMEGQIEIVKVMEETPNFTRYLIAYQPSTAAEPGRDEFRQITVEVERPGLEVRARKGYYP